MKANLAGLYILVNSRAKYFGKFVDMVDVNIGRLDGSHGMLAHCGGVVTLCCLAHGEPVPSMGSAV